MKCDASDIVGMAFEGQESIRVGRLDVVEFHIVAARSREESLVWRDAESVDLGVRVLNGTGTDA